MTCEKGHTYPDSDPYCTDVACLSYGILNYVRPPEGGVLTYVEGFKYPMQGFPLSSRLEAVATVKRAILATLKLLLSFPYSKKRLFGSLKTWLESIYAADLELKAPPREDFSTSAREILRVLETIWGRERWIYCLVTIYETDFAYRYRIQDVLGELDQKSLKLNPKREIFRLFDLALSRERNNLAFGVKSKWELLKKTAKWIFILSPQTLKTAKQILGDLDLSKIRMSINEKYWSASRFDYLYGGLTYEERMAWKAEEDKGWTPEQTKENPKLTLMPPNKEFYELSEEAATGLAEELKQAVLQNYKENK